MRDLKIRPAFIQFLGGVMVLSAMLGSWHSPNWPLVSVIAGGSVVIAGAILEGRR